MKFSVVIPVYNRPDETNNLIQSITNQSFKDLEVIVVEDGSILSSEKTIDKFKKNISLKYYNKKNEGPGLARNFGSKFITFVLQFIKFFRILVLRFTNF